MEMLIVGVLVWKNIVRVCRPTGSCSLSYFLWCVCVCECIYVCVCVCVFGYFLTTPRMEASREKRTSLPCSAPYLQNVGTEPTRPIINIF